MIDAIKQWGILRGTWMGLKRISSCHPWGSSGYDSVPKNLKNKSITSKQYDFLKSSTSAGFAILFFYIILMVCLANVFGGVPMGEATINPYSNELVDPSKMQIGFVVGLIGSTYYGREYFFHQKFLLSHLSIKAYHSVFLKLIHQDHLTAISILLSPN